MKLNELRNLSEALKTLTLYHGYSRGVTDELTTPVHLAYDKKLASMYGNGKVGVFEVQFKNALIISTETEFSKLWNACGNEIPEDAATMVELRKCEKYIEGKGHDGVIFKEGLWDDSQLFQDTFGQDGVIVFDTHTMKRTALLEGMMKRSDPYISGDVSHPAPAKTPVKSTAVETKLRNLAKRSGKSIDAVETLYRATQQTLDMTRPGAYAALTAKVERALGLRENLNEDEENFRHVENKDGELTYGWKSDLEDEEQRGYIPKGYKKRVLELGGIYASKPGKGQGDKLMKLFLASPEAQEAELIFLDPVPGLGANFKSKMSETEQVRRLQAFYRRYGFKNNPKANRMWLVKKGSIPDNKLPT